MSKDHRLRAAYHVHYCGKQDFFGSLVRSHNIVFSARFTAKDIDLHTSGLISHSISKMPLGLTLSLL